MSRSEVVECVVEIEQGSWVKHQKNYFDRLLSLPYPCCYGQITNSAVQQDGDFADFMLISTRFVPRGTVLRTEDLKLIACVCYRDKGERDDKYVFVLKSEYESASKESFMRFVAYKVAVIKHYLEYYKQLKHHNKVMKIYYSAKDFQVESEKIKQLDSTAEFKDLNELHTNYLLKEPTSH